MKFNLLAIVIVAVNVLASCIDNKTDKEIKEVDVKINIDSDTLNISKSKPVEHISLELVPMTLIDSNQNDPYKKYGFDLEGICYSCDVANISISSNKLVLTNACDSNKKKMYALSAVEKTGEKILAPNTDFRISLEKIKGADLYEVKIEGKSPATKDLKIRNFYCKQQELKKFQDHDCGDFEG